MKKLAFTLVLLVGTACGGGSGTAATSLSQPTPPTPTPPTESELIQQLLDGCGMESTSEFQGLFDLVVGLIGPIGPTPELVITGVFPLDTSFAWAVDVDNPPDNVNDVTGTTALRDALGNPSLGGISPTELLSLLTDGTDALPELITGVDAGTHIVTTFEGPAPFDAPHVTLSGTVTVVMGPLGVFDTTSGSLTTSAGTECTGTLSWTDIDISIITTPGTLPTGTFELTVTVGTDSITGTATLDGTTTVALSVSLNGGPPLAFAFDLTTGELSPVV